VLCDKNKFFVIDKSSNGTYINGERIANNVKKEVKLTDEVLLAGSCRIDLRKVIHHGSSDPDATRILVSGDSADMPNVELNFGEKTVVINSDKTEIGEILSMDNSSFITLGRSRECNIPIDKPSISKQHCRMRLIGPSLIEVEDLNSTNGTFADNVRLTPGERTRFTSAVKIRLGADTNLDLTKVLPGVQVIQTPIQKPVLPPNPSNTLITSEEKKAFEELKGIWEEYQERQQKIANSGSAIALGGMAASSILAVLAGPAGMLIGLGGNLMARYLSQQKVSKLRSDFTYEDMFLQVYACPRCKESFQKKPWVTIRDCARCKIKFK
jgi:pSer/pThr/pTyr-binding forkhead associated (FHA) protein